MSLYLGNQKVGVSQVIDTVLNEGDQILTAAQKAALNEGVNYKTGEFDLKNIPQMVSALKEKYLVSLNQELEIGTNSFEQWTRPNGWPDLDSLNLQMSDNTDCIYMTYDANNITSYGTIALQVDGSNIEVTLGHIENTTYIIDEIISATNNNQYIRSLNDLNGYPIIKITGTITRCWMINYTADNKTQYAQKQPMIERIAYIPNVTSLSSSDATKLWSSYFLEREKINNGNGNALTYLGYAWENAFRLASLDISGLKTQNVTSMVRTFRKCGRLNQVLDLRNWDISKVTNFEFTFAECYSIKEIYFNTSSYPEVAKIQYMFYSCFSLKYIHGLSNFSLNNVPNIYQLFNGCRNLRELEDLSNWDTSTCNTFAYVFKDCMSLKNLDFISSWDTSNVTSFYQLFLNCYNIEKLDLHTWDTSKVTNLYGTFEFCVSLKQLNITGWQINNVTALRYTFAYCLSLPILDLSGWNVNNACTEFYEMFYYCASLQYLDLNAWDLSGLTAGQYVFNSLFNNCWSLKRITGISNWTIKASNSLSAMFAGCYSLETLDISNWIVSGATSCSSMFYNCYSLKSLSINNWVTSACTTFVSMFSECHSLTTLNVSSFDTSNATTLSQMFKNCYSLTQIGNISNWNTSKVTSLSDMFNGCNSLKQNLDLSNWDVKKVTTVANMFANCTQLESLTLNNWNLAACTTISSIFLGCYNLKTLNVNNWSLPALTTNPTNFINSYTLVNYTGLPIKLTHSYAICYSLSYESVINIFNALPTLSSSKTLTLTTNVLNLTSATDRQIATNKGWNLATSTG